MHNFVYRQYLRVYAFVCSVDVKGGACLIGLATITNAYPRKELTLVELSAGVGGQALMELIE